MAISAPPEKPMKPAPRTAPTQEPVGRDIQAAQANDAGVIASPLIPTGLLDPTETVLLIVKPSAWIILFDSIRALMIVLAITILAVRLIDGNDDNILPQQVYAVAAGVMCVKLFWHFLDWVGRVYILTDKRLLVVSGVVRLTVCQRPIGQVKGLQVHHTFLERSVGRGTLSFALESESSQVLWRCISDPTSTAAQAWRLIERYTR